MSVLTNALIVCTYEDDTAIGEVNKYLHEIDTARHQQFIKIDNAMAGGTKYPSMTCYQACFNHLLDDEILDAFNGATWRYSHNLLIMESELTGYWIYDESGLLYDQEALQ